ncbi:hypothetical protein HP439_12055 [Sphingobacterium shayense]|uniref:hypothetical protein n=1 Tax=Sphingobacterium shayense TaxID=626343 RepID=UPI001551F3C6|nr:hypothetical protein [Sphingobacterium shayense]NQD71457.1 hypothetical protein [Sphingobacterium shayense]
MNHRSSGQVRFLIENEDDLDSEVDKLSTILARKELVILDDAKNVMQKRSVEQ